MNAVECYKVGGCYDGRKIMSWRMIIVKSQRSWTRCYVNKLEGADKLGCRWKNLELMFMEGGS